MSSRYKSRTCAYDLSQSAARKRSHYRVLLILLVNIEPRPFFYVSSSKIKSVRGLFLYARLAGQTVYYILYLSSNRRVNGLFCTCSVSSINKVNHSSSENNQTRSNRDCFVRLALFYILLLQIFLKHSALLEQYI